ncbi:MAG: hypothetical protein ACOZF0_02050 [Thermodesulfobacteriota bacterium]
MISKRISLLLALTVCSVCLLVNPAHAETWKITSLDWQPYSGSDMANQGESVNKLKELLKKEGIDLVVEFYPWTRAQKLAQTKDYIGYFPAWPEEVKEGFVASPPVDWSYIGVMTYAGSAAKWESVDQLFSQYRVGIIDSYEYPKEIADAVKKYPDHVKLAGDETALVKMLASKTRFEVALTDPNVMQYHAKLQKMDNIQVLNPSIQKKELVISLRNDEANKKVIERLNKLLQ